MGKSRRGNKQFSREQKLIHENQVLKKKVAQLRKQLARLDLDRYENVKDLIEEHYQDDKAQGQNIMETLKKEWACKECSGYLEVILFNKINSTYYYRKCSNCPHRTKSQKYDPNLVKGIIKNEKL